jgi:transcriptional regulator with GAF, ATPase, and Fis domain
MQETPLHLALADAARGLAVERSLPAAIQAVVSMVSDVVPGADAAAVMVWDRSIPDATVVTDEALREAVERHVWKNATPVLEACERREPVYSGDLGRELRWREFSRDLAGSLGINSVFAVPLPVREIPLGVLAVFGKALDAFDLEDQEAAQIAALHATVALADSIERRQLSRGLASRTVIGRATGVVMQHFDLDAATAFAVLRRLSECRHERLHDLAEHVVVSRLIE